MKLRGSLPYYRFLYKHQQDAMRSASSQHANTGMPDQSSAQLPPSDLVSDFTGNVAKKMDEFRVGEIAAGNAMQRDGLEPQTAAEMAQFQAALDEKQASYNFDKPKELKAAPLLQTYSFDQIRQKPFAHNDPMSTVPGFMGPMGMPKPPGM